MKKQSRMVSHHHPAKFELTVVPGHLKNLWKFQYQLKPFKSMNLYAFNLGVHGHWLPPKILLTVKLIVVIMISTLMQVSAASLAQKLNFSKKGVSLEEVFKEITFQTGYNVLYAPEKINELKKIDVSFKNTDIRDVLDQLIKNEAMVYTIDEKNIIIKPKGPSFLDRVVSAFANIDVRGVVLDETGNPLVGATVKVKDVNKSTKTNAQGEFYLQGVDEKSVLVISYLGYETKELNAAKDLGKVQMALADSKLEEVEIVSTGYQNIPRERATGSFAQPIKEEFNSRVAPDVLSKLAGITSGLVFNANTIAQKEGKNDINIRARNTIFANDQPLIVVDNFIYSGDINNINPNDVESVTILKDAAAASIWGVRAGNGVIVISTKKGSMNQALKVGFNANLTTFDKPDLDYNPNQLDAASYIALEQILFEKGDYTTSLGNTSTFPVISPVVELLAANPADLTAKLNVLKGLNVKDQLSKYFYQNATNQQYALNLSGGSSKAVYYFSSGYDQILPSTKENSKQRITINSQNTFYLLKNLELNAGINWVQTTNKADNTLGQIQSRLFPYSRIADEKGNPLPIDYKYRQSFILTAYNNGFLDWSYYPLNELGAVDNRTKVSDLRLSTGLKYTIIKGLSAEVKYQHQSSISQNRNFQSQQTYSTRDYINTFSILTAGKVTGYNVPKGGIMSLLTGNTISNHIRGQLNYSYSRKEHNLTVLAGYESSQTVGENNQSILYGYNDELTTFANINPLGSFNTYPSGNRTINSGLGTGETLERLRSSFANAAYSYKDRYILSGSARIDGTNYFGVATNQKSIPLWSVGVKWDIAKEAFYKSDWLPVLALRASYGYNGNLIQSITGVTTFKYYSNAVYTNFNFAEISNIGNPDLRWEKTGIVNIAVDFGTKNGLLEGSMEYYHKKVTDVLGFKSFPGNSGITSLQGNYSDMEGQGVDLSLTTRNLNGRLKWYSTLLLSYTTDKVTRYDIVPRGYQLVGAGAGTPNLGKPVFGVYGYKWGGLDPVAGNPIGFENGIPSQNYSTITTETPVNDLIYAGPARPAYFGGLNNRFNYKGFSLAVQLNYKLGYYFMAPALSYSGITSRGAFLTVNGDFNKRWQIPGDEKMTNVPSMVYPFSPARDQFYKKSEINIEKADHIRLQNISLSYDFNKQFYPKLPLNNLQLFLYANNVGILWKANHLGLDPDAVPTTDNTTMPNQRSISFGLKGSF